MFAVGNEVHFPAVGLLIVFSQTPHDSQNFRFDLVIASFRIGERDGEKERGWGGEGGR